MITCLDSSVLIDIVRKDPNHWEASLHALQKSRQLGSLLICPVVWAEVSCCFENTETMHQLFLDSGISFDGFDQKSSELSGRMWKEYRRQGGQREQMIADFLIAAHAQCRGGRLLTRDRGFYRHYFKDLQVVY